jgi:beta-lactam-binding protein with PASTA domain
MAPRSRIARQATTGLAAVLALLLTVVPTSGAVQTTPAVELRPTSGPPGTSVTAVATRFGDCPPPGNDDVGNGVVAFLWDGADELDTIEISVGSATAVFVVPESASLRVHEVAIRCVADESLSASASFSVTPPVEEDTVVPNLIGLSLEDAGEHLLEETLELGNVLEDGELVKSQDPLPGTVVEVGSAVDVTLGAAAPALVQVPNLDGLGLDSARAELQSVGLVLGGVSGAGEVVRGQSPLPGVEVPEGSAVGVTLARVESTVVVPDLIGLDRDLVPQLLASHGLVLGEVAGDGDIVRDQDPAAGAEVVSGTAVNISLRVDVPVERLVEVPNLVGLTGAEARAALVAAELVLAVDQSDDAAVESQQPIAGTLVPVGSAVAVTTSEPAPWRSLALVAIVLLVAALAAAQAVRVARNRAWVRAHIHAVPAVGSKPTADEIDR